MLRDVLDEPVGDFVGLPGAVEIGSGDLIVKRGFDRLLQQVRLVVPAQKIQHHSGSENRAERVSNSLPSDVGGGAVYGLKKRSAAGMDVPGGSEAETTSELCGQIADDVAKEIVGDDDVELTRVADQFHGEGVDVEMARLDFGKFDADGSEDALPKITSESHGIGFVGHAQAVEFVGASVFESVANDALDAFAGVDVFLCGDFVGRVLFEEAAGAHVNAFGVFAKDDEANIVGDAVFQRG